jgi:hypothetical protein
MVSGSLAAAALACSTARDGHQPKFRSGRTNRSTSSRSPAACMANAAVSKLATVLVFTYTSVVGFETGQPATRFAVLDPFSASRSSRKVLAHFSMSCSKTWRRIILMRRALLRGESFMASTRRSLRPLMS